jgi:uncharacterized membrane protein
VSSSLPAYFFYYPTNDEKTYAMLAHILGIFSGFLAPLIMLLIKRDSKFVLFHALQSLAWHFICFIVLMGGVFITLAILFATGSFPPPEKSPDPPVTFLLFFGAFWLIAMAAGISSMVLGIMYGLRANKGEWARYPLIGEFILNKFVFN